MLNTTLIISHANHQTMSIKNMEQYHLARLPFHHSRFGETVPAHQQATRSLSEGSTVATDSQSHTAADT